MSYVAVWDGHGLRRAGGPGLGPGPTPVEQMLQTPGATWAHRGGSATWPEMTRYAYDQSHARGYRILEFSAQRSSDGWWFGLHDNSLDRTSQVSGMGPISSLTREEIESHSVTLGSGAPQPYFDMIEFLEMYQDCVLVVDPKDAIFSHRTEFLDILDQYAGPGRAITKFFGHGGGNPGSFAAASAARGYQCWGYFYEQDVASGALASGQHYWSLLGMEYGASQESWDAVLSYGKPVVAHIAPTRAAYDEAISKGASMVQCSGVSTIEAVSWEEGV